MRIKILLGTMLLFVGLSSCVRSYQAISTHDFGFADRSDKPDVSIVHSDSLLFADQDRFSFVPVSIHNNSANLFEINEKNISVFYNYELVALAAPKAYNKSIRKKYWGYTVMASLGAVQALGISSEGVQPNSSSVVGASMIVIAGVYIFRTLKYNKMQKRDLLMLDLNGQSIAPGETKTGILILNQPNCENISIRIE